MDALPARRVLERVILEHMAHGGTQNGDLTVTYDDFALNGLSSRRITGQAIRCTRGDASASWT